MGHIKIEIESVHCITTEDNLGEDEFYYISNLQCGTFVEREGPDPVVDLTAANTKVSKILDINDGQTKKFPSPDDVLFDETCDDRGAVTGNIYWFDADRVEDDNKNRVLKYIIITLATILITAGGWAGLLALGIPWWGAALILIFPVSVFIGVILRYHVFKRIYWVIDNVDFDKDDYLGGHFLCIPVLGAPSEKKVLIITGHTNGITSNAGDKWEGSGNVAYDIVLKITRG